jgi:hypothetical protein
VNDSSTSYQQRWWKEVAAVAAAKTAAGIAALVAILIGTALLCAPRASFAHDWASFSATPDLELLEAAWPAIETLQRNALDAGTLPVLGQKALALDWLRALREARRLDPEKHRRTLLAAVQAVVGTVPNSAEVADARGSAADGAEGAGAPDEADSLEAFEHALEHLVLAFDRHSWESRGGSGDENELLEQLAALDLEEGDAEVHRRAERLSYLLELSGGFPSDQRLEALFGRLSQLMQSAQDSP